MHLFNNTEETMSKSCNFSVKRNPKLKGKKTEDEQNNILIKKFLRKWKQSGIQKELRDKSKNGFTPGGGQGQNSSTFKGKGRGKAGKDLGKAGKGLGKAGKVGSHPKGAAMKGSPKGKGKGKSY